MASLPSENPYNAQGTVLFKVIPTTECRAQMLGKTAVDHSPGELGATSKAAPSGVSFKGASAAASTGAGADGRPLAAAAAATAALNAQKQQQYARAALAASTASATRSGATLGSTGRGGPTSSILLPSASKAAVSASRRPGRLAPLDGAEDTVSSQTPAGTISASAQTLTVEKALAQLFQPAPVAATRASAESRGSTVSETVDALAAPCAEAEWMQVASTSHTSRIDVVMLHQHLAKRCQEEHARPAGSLCATREAIFNDGYRELMRQITVTCPERGLLMETLDQHMALSTDAYDSLFDSACQYAARKSIERDLRRYLFDDKTKLESEVRRLENRVNELRAKHDGLLKRFDEQKTSTEKMQEEELGYLKKANQQLVSEIKRLSTLESTMNAAAKTSAEGA